VLIVLPAVVSGIGIAFVVVAVIVGQEVVRAVFLSLGLLMLWLDIFLTLLLMRRWLRNLNARLQRIEAKLEQRQQ
jgi:hypothetical protein